MKQIVYISSAVGSAPTEAILAVSRANNRRDGLTGLLYADGRRFLQALEGEDEVLTAALHRIRADPRHRAVVILSERDIAAREFGEWAMAEPVADADAAAFVARVEQLVANATPSVRATFESFVRLRYAA